MALPTYCPSCPSIRQPNGSFCHVWGYSCLMKEFPEQSSPHHQAPASSTRLAAGDGYRFDLGSCLPLFIVSLIGFVVSIVLFVSMLGAIFGGPALKVSSS